MCVHMQRPHWALTLQTIVDEIVAENPPQTAHRCLSTLLSIAQNISRDREKYGMLKGTNERLNKDVIQVEGARQLASCIALYLWE